MTEPEAAAGAPITGTMTAAEAADVAENPQADKSGDGTPPAAVEALKDEVRAAGTTEAAAATEAQLAAQTPGKVEAAAGGQAAVVEPPAAVPAVVSAAQVCRGGQHRACLNL